jgi:hypothetical protein
LLPALRPQRRVRDDPIVLSANERRTSLATACSGAEPLLGERKRHVVAAAVECDRRQPTARFLGYGQLVGLGSNSVQIARLGRRLLTLR